MWFLARFADTIVKTEDWAHLEGLHCGSPYCVISSAITHTFQRTLLFWKGLFKCQMNVENKSMTYHELSLAWWYNSKNSKQINLTLKASIAYDLNVVSFQFREPLGDITNLYYPSSYWLRRRWKAFPATSCTNRNNYYQQALPTMLAKVERNFEVCPKTKLYLTRQLQIMH